MIIPLVIFVFMILAVTGMLMSMFTYMMFRAGILSFGDRFRIFYVMIGLLIVSIIVSTALVAIFGKWPLKPIRNLKNAAKEIAKGNFSVRIPVKGNTELDELIMDFNAMAAELGSVGTLRNDFIDNFSHEFKTPIVSIRGFARLLQKDNLTEDERKEYLDIIIEESGRLVQLSQNILSLSKLETQEIMTEKTRFALDEQIRRTILMLEPSWTRKNIQFAIDMENAWIVGNEEIIKQAWMNLLDNAIKFTPHHGIISISVRNIDNTVQVTIADNGIGMDQKTIKHIFDRFYQGANAVSSRGNGLGLALVKRILDLHGASIAVESELGGGTKFMIDFQGN